MSRNNNIAKGKKADEKIIGYLENCKGIYGITEIGDYQQEKWNRELKPTEQMENSINQYLGTDYIVITEGTKYKSNGQGFNIVNVDTKGFNYNPKYYGQLQDGIVEKMLLQVEKFYGGNKYHGWANNPKYLTRYVLILINNHIYFIDYRKLVEYCGKFNRTSPELVEFGEKLKGKGNYELCIKASVPDMIDNKVITNIIPIQ